MRAIETKPFEFYIGSFNLYIYRKIKGNQEKRSLCLDCVETLDNVNKDTLSHIRFN